MYVCSYIGDDVNSSNVLEASSLRGTPVRGYEMDFKREIRQDLWIERVWSDEGVCIYMSDDMHEVVMRHVFMSGAVREWVMCRHMYIWVMTYMSNDIHNLVMRHVYVSGAVREWVVSWHMYIWLMTYMNESCPSTCIYVGRCTWTIHVITHVYMSDDTWMSRVSTREYMSDGILEWVISQYMHIWVVNEMCPNTCI